MVSVLSVGNEILVVGPCRRLAQMSDNTSVMKLLVCELGGGFQMIFFKVCAKNIAPLNFNFYLG